MKKKGTLSDKLKNYSLLAGSVMASSLAAQAQVIYTDISPDKVLGGSVPSSFPDVQIDSLDLNNDGVTDFKIILKFYGIDDSIPGYNFREHMEGVELGNSVGSYEAGGYAAIALQFKSGDSIPQNLFAPFFHSVNFAFQSGSSTVPFWKNEKDTYIGLKLTIGADVHYGWLRLDANTDSLIPGITLKDFAYQETSNVKIAAGEGLVNGVSSLQNQNSSIIFPNPSNGQCTVRLGHIINGLMHASVTDQLGRIVYENNFTGDVNELHLDLSDLIPGNYFISIKSASVAFTQNWIKSL
ncbi:MAG: T9SS type A sorting domain-containing protein [Chitinophagales bacterium]|nr:T9SS type A sorting domain-containing protein [Chitinophagales bacterium]